jgi:NAD(P)-dependent dehydrogenase (short-subunit alcohol dehydrogenase family)
MRNMSPEELTRCAAILEELAAAPAEFLDKQAPHFAELAAVRRHANRLIERLKGAVRSKRGQPANGIKSQPPTPASPQTPAPPRVCYACQQMIGHRHAHYDWMCQACGEWNRQKREQQADLVGRVAVVTGARVRIGFQTSLKLLRAGARVHVVTRFPHDAAERYQHEPDWTAWQERVCIHGLDLRDLAGLQDFIAHLAREPLDILINNAAQTLRPTPEFFAQMHRQERLLSQQLAPAILKRLQSSSGMAILPERASTSSYLDALGPTGHSWVARIDDIAPVEALEVQVINSLAPFLLIQGLLPALRRSPWPRRFIINVASREGQFAGKATVRHPHTNMAKAALNMLTRSLATELRPQGIFINSVDPGWVSDQMPLARQEGNAWLPLDDVDAAARVLDPIFHGVSSPEPPPSGMLWRNYQPADW